MLEDNGSLMKIHADWQRNEFAVNFAVESVHLVAIKQN